jgi:hypothetical protein
MSETNVDLSKVRASDYLSEGFLNVDGTLREGINGYGSLAMAYQCRTEGMHPDTLQEIMQKILLLGTRKFTGVSQEPLNSEVLSSLQQIIHSDEVASSATLSEVLRVAERWIHDWKSFGALILHLERILSQLALLTVVRTDTPSFPKGSTIN